ncbi:MAG: methyltransferase domain-containing protein [Filimonas sp.]|nr:methyltransferase domain-containing protein [Filimonas sp.]
MSRYTHRSSLTELIDAPGVPFDDWSQCLHELNVINTWLGGHVITLQGVKQLLEGINGPVIIAEIGCGGGDNLKAIHAWNRHKGLQLEYVGVDYSEACIDFAKENCSALPVVSFIHSDYRTAQFQQKPDIIFSSLFCHHFTDAQLLEMMLWLDANTTTGFFINDLQRHPLAYYSIKWLTALLSNSYLVKNDAPISVLRGFRKAEWECILQQAGIKQYSIHWKWAFRYLIVVCKSLALKQV